jgi:hypothetical protein
MATKTPPKSKDGNSAPAANPTEDAGVSQTAAVVELSTQVVQLPPAVEGVSTDGTLESAAAALAAEAIWQALPEQTQAPQPAPAPHDVPLRALVPVTHDGVSYGPDSPNGDTFECPCSAVEQLLAVQAAERA